MAARVFPRALLLICALLAAALPAACDNGVPTKAAIPATQALPIDGSWEAIIGNQRVPVSIDGGRIIAVDSQKVLVRNIRTLSDSEYSCEGVLVVAGQFHSYIPAKILMVTPAKFILEIPPTPDKRYGGGSELYVRLGAADSARPGATQLPSILTVHIASESNSIEVKTEQITVSRGVISKIKRSRKIIHEVQVSDSSSLEGSLKLDWKAISGEVKKQIEEKLGQSFRQEESYEQEVQVDGSAFRVYKLSWFDVVRTGTIEWKDSGKTKVIPFQFRESTELRVVGTD